MTTTDTGRLWAIVLAAGEGRRLASLTRALYGRQMPKQFASLDGERSMLQATLDRIASLVPESRTVVVVPHEHAALAASQLARHPGVHVIAQPRNAGTGAGVLLPLSYVTAQDAGARVVVFPSDHSVVDSEAFLHAVRVADAAGARVPCQVTIVGVAATRPEGDYGWIVPGRRARRGAPPGVREVVRFVEKPPAALAEDLRAGGALWNTFVCAGHATAFWALAKLHLPAQTRLFAAYLNNAGRAVADDVLREVYAQLAPSDFSRDVLGEASGLACVAADGCGWSDWGRPERIFADLRGTPALERLLARLPPSHDVFRAEA